MKKLAKDRQSVGIYTRFTPSEAALLRKACRKIEYLPFPDRFIIKDRVLPSEIRRHVLLDWAVKVTAATEKPADLLK